MSALRLCCSESALLWQLTKQQHLLIGRLKQLLLSLCADLYVIVCVQYSTTTIVYSKVWYEIKKYLWSYCTENRAICKSMTKAVIYYFTLHWLQSYFSFTAFNSVLNPVVLGFYDLPTARCFSAGMTYSKGGLELSHPAGKIKLQPDSGAVVQQNWHLLCPVGVHH